MYAAIGTGVVAPHDQDCGNCSADVALWHGRKTHIPRHLVCCALFLVNDRRCSVR